MPTPRRPDPFAAVMGTRRGGGGRLDSAQPDARARADADAICRDVADEYFTAAVVELHRNEAALTAPLLVQILDAVVDGIQKRILGSADVTTALVILRLSPHVERDVIAADDDLLHFWPEPVFLSAADVGIETNCKQTWLSEDCAHVDRGAWMKQRPAPRCFACERTPWPQSAKDEPDRGLARELLEELDPGLRAAVRSTVVELAGEGKLDIAAVARRHGAAHRGEVSRAAARRLKKDGEDSCMRIMFKYARLRTHAGRQLSEVLDDAHWEHLAETAFALGRALPALAYLLRMRLSDEFEDAVWDLIP